MTTIANPMQRMGASRLVQLQFESLWPLVPPLMVVVGLFQRHEPFGREGSTRNRPLRYLGGYHFSDTLSVKRAVVFQFGISNSLLQRGQLLLWSSVRITTLNPQLI